VIWRVPPTSAARSRIDDIPTPGVQALVRGAGSRMVTARPSSPSSMQIQARSVPLCRAEFVTASVAIRYAATSTAAGSRGRLPPSPSWGDRRRSARMQSAGAARAPSRARPARAGACRRRGGGCCRRPRPRRRKPAGVRPQYPDKPPAAPRSQVTLTTCAPSRKPSGARHDRHHQAICADDSGQTRSPPWLPTTPRPAAHRAVSPAACRAEWRE
jgi:hypothetical protein